MAIAFNPVNEELAKRAAARKAMSSMSDRETLALEGIYDELTKLNALVAASLVDQQETARLIRQDRKR